MMSASSKLAQIRQLVEAAGPGGIIGTGRLIAILDDAPDRLGDAVSGWTTHGHPVPGVPQVGVPKYVMRCGGPRLCERCSREAAVRGPEDDRMGS